MLKHVTKGVVCTAAVIASLAGQANAQTCTFVTGPDVIVGAITGPTNYTISGTRDAVSFGTTSCNKGNTPLAWNASPANTHPVIGGTLYKWSTVGGAGRFEQIGVSWLKHGFTALQGTTCCTNCTANPNGTALGVGCSDPYTSSRNGTQSGLGPRATVNANTGNYPTGTPLRPTTGNLGRCEVEIADLAVSSATVRYVGECQYVTPDDAAAGNNDNNASRIEVSCTGTAANYTFGFIGSTVRESPAIQAWPTFETGVTLTTVDVPSEGRFIVGSKATDIGGGMWHYEYAVFNLNSDRCGGSFSIPVPAGVNVTNMGFHGVTHRDASATGALSASNVAWTTTNASGILTFACEPVSTNPTANAIRWGTTYNFRFDADAAPAASGNATLGLWKTGTPAAVTAAAAVPGCASPNFTTQPGTASACNNGSASFTVAASASPSFVWQRETSPGVFTNLTDGVVAGLGTVAGSGTATLSLTNLEATAAGNYHAVATNACNTATSTNGVLTMLAPGNPACGPVCDAIDFNGDGLLPDTQDIDDFLSVFSGGPCSTGTCGDIDFNNDGLLPDTQDIDSFLSVFSGGPCI